MNWGIDLSSSRFGSICDRSSLRPVLPRSLCQFRVVQGWTPRVVQEELPVQLDEVLPLLRGLVLDEDRLHRADGLAGPAVDAFVGVDIELLRAFVDAVHRADLDAGLVLHVDSRLGDDIRHRDLLFSPLSLAADEARQPLPREVADVEEASRFLDEPRPPTDVSQDVDAVVERRG